LVKPTDKPLTNSFVADEAAVSVVSIAFSEYLIDGAQVQVDSVIQVELDDLQVDSVMQIICERIFFLPHHKFIIFP